MKQFRKNACLILFASFFPCTNVSVGAQNILAPLFELVSQIISCTVLDQMLFEASKNTAFTDEPWVQSMKQFASTKMYQCLIFVITAQHGLHSHSRKRFSL